MKSLLLLTFVAALAACDHVMAQQVVGSGVARVEKRNVSGFQSIEAAGALYVEITAQREPSLEIEADDNVLQHVTTEVRGGTLFIRSERNISSKKGVRVRIGMQNVTSIVSEGANSFVVSDIKNDALRITASGASNVTLSGQTATLQMQLNGASNAQTENLLAERVTVELNGAGKASVHASQELNAQVAGAASVTYTGDPKTVNRKVFGVGTVSPK